LPLFLHLPGDDPHFGYKQKKILEKTELLHRHASSQVDQSRLFQDYQIINFFSVSPTCSATVKQHPPVHHEG
jgi:hypothetical protein